MCVCVCDTVVYMYVADNYFIVFQMCTVKYDIISGVEYVHSLYHKYFVYIIIIKNVKFPQRYNNIMWLIILESVLY